MGGVSATEASVLARDRDNKAMNLLREPERSKEPRDKRRLLSLKDAAIELGVSTATMRRLISTGRLPAVRLTRRLQIDVRDLDRLIQQGKEGGMR
jgi:excisionase family DNA binding protein